MRITNKIASDNIQKDTRFFIQYRQREFIPTGTKFTKDVRIT